MKIKKLLALVLTVAMVISMLVMPASAAGLKDIKDHWAKDSIERWSLFVCTQQKMLPFFVKYNIIITYW